MTTTSRSAPFRPRISRLSQALRFLRVARLLLWTLWVIYRERRRVVRARERGDTSVQPDVEVLIRVLTAYRRTALQLGGLMIKLGQFLSARADLLPERALSVLGALQDEVPAAPYAQVEAVLRAELGRPVAEVFSDLAKEATAAASLGQVHKGVLAATGEMVAVKVQRPGIDRLVGMDLSSLRFVIWVINRFTDTSDVLDLTGFFHELRRTTLRELDYVAEAENAARFKELFADRPGVFIPRVHPEYTSQRLLVLEWVDGIKINDYTALEAAGVDRLAVARQTVEAYLYQFFELGFFHADPHPGNIFVLPDGAPPGGAAAAAQAGPHAAGGGGSTLATVPARVAFVDFGMTGTLPAAARRAFTDLFLAFLAGSAHGMVDALQRLGFIGPGANIAAIERGVALMLAQYRNLSLGQARDLDFHAVASEIEALLYGQPFRIPVTFAFTGKAIGTLAGVATGLAPQLNLVDVAVPYARRFLGLGAGGSGDGATVQQALRQALDAGRTLLTLPPALERVLAKLETGQIQIQLADGPIPGPGGRRTRRSGAASSGGAASALVAISALAAGVVLLIEHLTVPGWLCLGLGAAGALLTWLRR